MSLDFQASMQRFMGATGKGVLVGATLLAVASILWMVAVGVFDPSGPGWPGALAIMAACVGLFALVVRFVFPSGELDPMEALGMAFFMVVTSLIYLALAAGAVMLALALIGVL